MVDSSERLRSELIVGISEDLCASRRRGGEQADLGVLSGVYPKLLHSCKQGCAIQAHSCSSSVRTTDPPFAFRECAYDFFALVSGKLVGNIFLRVEGTDRFFYDTGNFVVRGPCSGTRPLLIMTLM